MRIRVPSISTVTALTVSAIHLKMASRQVAVVIQVLLSVIRAFWNS